MGYDEPETLRCSNPQICPKGPDVRQVPSQDRRSERIHALGIPVTEAVGEVRQGKGSVRP